MTIDIKMNDVVIGQATAAHRNENNGFRGYDCTMWYRDRDGYLYEAEWELWGHLKADCAVPVEEL